MKTPFRKPEEIPVPEETEQVSTRIKKSAADALKKAAKSKGESLSWMAGRILEDYVAWLKAQK